MFVALKPSEERDSADDVVANWEAIKKAEKGRQSVFDGIPADLPALLYALKVAKKAAAVGIDPAEVAPPPDAALRAATDHADDHTVGTLLLAAVGLARSADVDPETALRGAAARLRDRGRAVEGSTAPDLP